MNREGLEFAALLLMNPVEELLLGEVEVRNQKRSEGVTDGFCVTQTTTWSVVGDDTVFKESNVSEDEEESGTLG
jgi:hypothetical protein